MGVRIAGRRAVSARNGDVLLTGATGFVGMELLARYLERTERQIVTLVRAADDEAATARMDGGAGEPVRLARRALRAAASTRSRPT